MKNGGKEESQGRRYEEGWRNVTTRTNIQDWQCFFITIVVNAALFDK